MMPSYDPDRLLCELYDCDPERAIGLGVPSLSLGLYDRWLAFWRW